MSSRFDPRWIGPGVALICLGAYLCMTEQSIRWLAVGVIVLGVVILGRGAPRGPGHGG
jgi:hypothetical protein